MNTGGMTARIFTFARSVVGHVRGGLAHVAVLASMIPFMRSYGLPYGWRPDPAGLWA